MTLRNISNAKSPPEPICDILLLESHPWSDAGKMGMFTDSLVIILVISALGMTPAVLIAGGRPWHFSASYCGNISVDNLGCFGCILLSQDH